MTIALRFFAPAALLLGSLVATGSADVNNVPADQPSIQAAIDIALEGDEIVVSPGTYNEALLVPGFTITLRSSDGPQLTVIDATNAPGGPSSVIRFDIPLGSPEPQQYMIEGFTITGGTGNPDPFDPKNILTTGGGLNISADGATEVVIRDCIIENNQASIGGGIIHFGGSLRVENSIIRNNIASYEGTDTFFYTGNGGGILTAFVDILTINGCTFENNHAPNSSGGAIFFEAINTEISNSVFENNSCSRSGGALFTSSPNQFLVSKCEFRNNSTTGTSPAMAYGGGAIGIENGGFSSRVSQSMFYGNHTSGFNTTGGAIMNRMSSSGMLIDGCVFADNSSMYAGGALGLGGGELILNSTFANNNAIFGQAMFANEFSFGSFIDNSIIWGNGVGAPVFDVSNNSITINYSIIEGGWNGLGNGNIDADPMFVDAANHDLSLMSGSPANDSGDTFLFANYLPSEEVDIAGNKRLNDDPSVAETGFSILGQCIDRGAYEFVPGTAPACLADLNNDGVLNFFDVSIFITAFSAGCP